MRESWLLNRDARGTVPRLSFTDSDGVGCPGGAWLRKTQGDSGRQRKQYRLNQRRDLLQHVSSLILPMVGQPAPHLSYQQPPLPVLRMGRRMLVTNRLEQLCLPMENLLRGEPGRSWAMRATSGFPGVEQEDEHERRRQ